MKTLPRIGQNSGYGLGQINGTDKQMDRPAISRRGNMTMTGGAIKTTKLKERVRERRPRGGDGWGRQTIACTPQKDA